MSKQEPAAQLVNFGGEVYVIVKEVSDFIKTSHFISDGLANNYEFAVSLNTGKLVFYRRDTKKVKKAVTVELFVNGIKHSDIVSQKQAESLLRTLCEIKNLTLSLRINNGGFTIINSTSYSKALESFLLAVE